MTDQPTIPDLEVIRRRAEGATPGPWTWDGHRVPTLIGRAGDPAVYSYDVEVIEADHDGECGCRSACTLHLRVRPQDADFIAHAREDITVLLAEVDRLRAALARHDVEATSRTQAPMEGAGAELLAELERAATDYDATPEHLRPVVTAAPGHLPR